MKSDERPAVTERPDVAYEPRDVNARALFAIGIGILVAAVLIHFSVMFAFDYFAARDRQNGMQPTTLVPRESVWQPPEPRLQVDPAGDLKEMRANEAGVLNNYGWVDEQKGVVRIPIERAMQLVVERGLPPSTAASGAQQGGTKTQPEAAQESKQESPATANSRRTAGRRQP